MKMPKQSQASQKMARSSSPMIVATFAVVARALGRRATNRAARICASGELCRWPGKRSSIETRTFSASDVDNAARRAASSRGSTFKRANAGKDA